MKKLMKGMVVASLLFASVGCGSNTSSSDDLSTKKIAVNQLMKHESLDQSYEGFKEVVLEAGILEENIDYQVAGEASNCMTVAEKQANADNDLIYAITTPSLQAAVASTSEIPIVGGSVTDFVATKLVESNEHPGGNVTGTSDLLPVKEQISLLKQLKPETKSIGIMYTSSEDNSIILADIAKEVCDELGYEYKIYTVGDSNEIQAVTAQVAADGQDAVYIPTDNTLATYLPSVEQILTAAKIPMIVGAVAMISDGGLATYGIDYYNLGKIAGQQAVSILKGEVEVSECPIAFLSNEDCELYINLKTAKACGLDINKADFENAHFVE